MPKVVTSSLSNLQEKNNHWFLISYCTLWGDTWIAGFLPTKFVTVIFSITLTKVMLSVTLFSYIGIVVILKCGEWFFFSTYLDRTGTVG